MRSVAASYRINWPSLASGTISFSFSTNTPSGAFQFTFRYLLNPVDGTSSWGGWATLPSGEVRQFGCRPDVADWTGFTDYGIVVDSTLPVLGQSDLVDNSTLWLIVWGAD